MDKTLFAKINAEFFVDLGKTIEERYVIIAGSLWAWAIVSIRSGALNYRM